jgi:hypothetical protein
MREFLALIVTVIVGYVVYSVFFASSTPDSGPPPPDSQIPLIVELGIGQSTSIVIDGVSYKVGLSAVSDSRCLNCPDPGQATAVVFTQPAGGRKTTLRIPSNAPTPVGSGPMLLQVVNVKPDAATAGQKIGKKNYRVSLEVDHKAAAPVDSMAVGAH